MSHLARVNRWLYQILDPILYLMDAKPYNQYALFWAAEHNLLAVAERALRAGTPVQPHNDVPSPLRPFGRILTGQELKAATKSSNFSRRTTPLDIVAEAGHCAIAALLLRDPRLIRSFDVELAIHSAAVNDRAEMVDMLLWHVEQVHKECMSHMIGCAFIGAGLHQSVAVLKLLVENGARLAVISRERYSLYQMNYAWTGHDELWDLFSSIRPLELVPHHRIQRQDLRSKLTARVTGKGSRGIVELVETFTSLGFGWKGKRELAWMLRMALRRDNVPLMELLLSYSSDEQNELEKMGPEDANIVVVLLEHGVNIEQLNSSDERPLFVACSSLNHSVASILLEKGADRSRETLRGFAKRYIGFNLNASLDVYAHEMVKLLLFHGVDRVFVTEEMMDFGSSGRLYETFRLLLMHGVGVEIDKLPFRNKKRPSRTKKLAEAPAWDTRM
ncbi:hypothetical protein ARSEF1564_007435 [Beauveria bassiana]